MQINRKKIKKKILNATELSKEILDGNNIVLSKTITLLESTKAEHHNIAQEVLENILKHTGKSIRIGITGVPGVGKSTFIESLGQFLLKENKKIAVLAIDPSSQKSKGSILGDKTRMENISSHPNVFIRPSPAGKQLGGVNRKTRETILLCEAAGYDIIFVETVGVGQSEIAVHSMTDIFLLLALTGAGDEIQGIKRGIMEMADIVAINKIENYSKEQIKNTVRQYKNALHLLPRKENQWISKVLTCSAIEHTNINEIWRTIQNYQNLTKLNGSFEEKRKQQAIYWLEESIQYYIMQQFYTQKGVKENIAKAKENILNNKISSFTAADKIISDYLKQLSNGDK